MISELLTFEVLFVLLEYIDNILYVILFVIIGFIFSSFSKLIYELYKRSLLSFQTFMLRYQCYPHVILINKCKSAVGYIKNLFDKESQTKTPWRQPKGLVGVIAIDMKRVLAPTVGTGSHLEDIYFAEKGGDYHARNTHLPVQQIKAEYKKIQDYYTVLSSEINQNFGDNRIFKYETLGDNGEIISIHLCDCFKAIYSYEKIIKARDEVNKTMASNNAVHFIGDKIGVSGFHMINGELTMDVYRTDHFTWQVFKEIFKANKPFFQEVMLRVNQADDREKQYLVKLLAFLFSSFGIDIIIEGLNCRKERQIIITARSAKIEKDRKATLHVSVNETFSRTDSVENNEKYSFIECVRRGIEEEIGIPQTLITENVISFHDFAIVTDEGEIGLSCHVDLSDVMPVEKMLMYPGQDKFLENEELILLPYFKMSHIELVKSMDSPEYMRQFYISTMCDRFSMPWMSFTPLLISRVMIRNIRFSVFVKGLLIAIMWLCLAAVSFFLGKLSVILIVEQLIGAISQIGIEAWYRARKRQTHDKYRFIQPLVSQWSGNAKVVQATGVSRKDKTVISDGLSFDLSCVKIAGPLNLSELVLDKEPYCSVRRKRSKDVYTEKPISSYVFRAHNPIAEIGTLHFYSPNIWCDSSSMTLDIAFDYALDKGLREKKIKKISFTKELDVLLDLSETEGVAEHVVLPDDFKAKYELLDLFSYKGNYYWSCMRTCESKEPDFIISQDPVQNCEVVKNIYKTIDGVIKNTSDDEGTISVRIKGDSAAVEQWLCAFASERNNRRRVSELELYMLQFYLIRDDKIFADCTFKNRVKFKRYQSSAR